MRRAGVEIDVFHYRGGWSPVRYLLAVLRFHRALRGTSYDLVFVRFGQCGLVGLSQRALPVVVWYGGTDLLGWRDDTDREPLASRFLRRVGHFVARRADEVIVDAEVMARHLPPNSYHVIPSGVDLERFRRQPRDEARRALGLDPDGRLVLFASNPRRLVKRYAVATEAVARLPSHLDARLVVASGVRHDQMPLYMSACDALVLTSEHEGSPNVVKEALACDLPVVAVDVGDVRERLEGLTSCIVCSDHDPATITDALATVLVSRERPALRASLVDIDTERMATKLRGVMEAALAGDG